MGDDPGRNRAQPPLRPIGPAFLPAVLALIHALLPLLLRFRVFPWLPAGIRRIDVLGADRLGSCFHRFAAGETRLILAVRHCEVDDPLLGLHLLARVLPRQAAHAGLRVPRPAHVHFLFDRGMPLWGGRPLGWVLSWLGGVSIRRGRRPDRTAMGQARELLLNGRFPFALAPEGATNGHGERVGPLLPGVAQLALRCVDDLRQAHRGEEVVILPIGLRYSYCKPQWGQLERLMARLERRIGRAASAASEQDPAERGADPAGRLYPRLTGLAGALLEQLERSYGPLPADDAAEGSALDALQLLVEQALATAEARLGIHPAGTSAERCRRIEEVVWQAVFPDGLPPRRQLSALQRSLADRAAREASMAEVHMRVAECLVAVSGRYVAEQPSFDRFMETTLLIHDAVSRLLVRGLPRRPRLGARRALIRVGRPLSVSTLSSRRPAEQPGARPLHHDRDLIRAICGHIRSEFEILIRRPINGPPAPPLRR